MQALTNIGQKSKKRKKTKYPTHDEVRPKLLQAIGQFKHTGEAEIGGTFGLVS